MNKQMKQINKHIDTDILSIISYSFCYIVFTPFSPTTQNGINVFPVVQDESYLDRVG